MGAFGVLHCSCAFCYGYYGGLKVLFGKSPKGEKKRV